MEKALRLSVAEETEAASLVGGQLDDPRDVGGGSVAEVDIGVCVAGRDMGDAVGLLGVAFGYDPGAALAGGRGRAGGSGSSGRAGDAHVRGHPDELDGELGAHGRGRGRERGGALAVGPGGRRVIDGGVARGRGCGAVVCAWVGIVVLSGLHEDSRRLSADVVEERGEERKRETHDRVCRVRSELGETTRVEDVSWEDIAQGGECLGMGGIRGGVVRHCCSCRSCSCSNL